MAFKISVRPTKFGFLKYGPMVLHGRLTSGRGETTKSNAFEIEVSNVFEDGFIEACGAYSGSAWELLFNIGGMSSRVTFEGVE